MEIENKGLLFIPDISGFTRFVNQTEIEHSRMIIQELLEIIINSNEIGLHISEVEGDAILFYKFGEAPSLAEIYRQVKKMFCAFHENVIAYNERRYCQCLACTSVGDLTLKIITHYGEFTSYQVKTFNKLIGKDIIVAHRLLKNDIPNNEYWLVTSNITKNVKDARLSDAMEWYFSTKVTEDGDVPFHYILLASLKESLKASPAHVVDLSGMTKVISMARVFQIDIITLFHATGDFNYRARWYDGVKSVEVENHFLPRIGMRCRFVMENGHEHTYSSSYSYQSDKIQFSEMDEGNRTCTYYTLEQQGRAETKLTIDYFIANKIIPQTIFEFTKRRSKRRSLMRSMRNLSVLAQDLRLSETTD